MTAKFVLWPTNNHVPACIYTQTYIPSALSGSLAQHPYPPSWPARDKQEMQCSACSELLSVCHLLDLSSSLAPEVSTETVLFMSSSMEAHMDSLIP